MALTFNGKKKKRFLSGMIHQTYFGCLCKYEIKVILEVPVSVLQHREFIQWTGMMIAGFLGFWNQTEWCTWSGRIWLHTAVK